MRREATTYMTGEPRASAHERWIRPAALPVAALLSLAVVLGLASQARADFRAITVPFRQHDTSIPHPAYNGHPTTFKAIAREVPGGCTLYYRWDVDDDGTWDTCLGRNFANAAGRWYTDSRYNLDCRQQLTYADPAESTRKPYLATIEVTCGIDAAGNPLNSRFATYPVMIFADVPQGRAYRADLGTYAYNARPPAADTRCVNSVCVGNNNFPCSSAADCEGDDDEDLEVKRAVAIEDALWYLHKLMTRWGEGVNSITGGIEQNATHVTGITLYQANTAAFLWGLIQNGHAAAWPPNTYQHNAATTRALPANWAVENNRRYNDDPLAEDAMRAFQYLLNNNINSNYGISHVTDPGAEGNDGRVPVANTDNNLGYWSSSSYVHGHVLGSVSAAGMGGTTVQVGPAWNQPVEYFVQELVDTACYNQIKEGQSGSRDAHRDDGGWCYGYRDYTDGSTAQWMMIGLEAADRAMSPYNVIVNQDCKYRVANHAVRNQDANGSGRYVNWVGGSDPHLTGGLLLGHGWLGTNSLPDTDATSFGPQSPYTNRQMRAAYYKAFKYLGDQWNCNFLSGVSWQGCNWSYPAARFDGAGMGSVYSIYSIQKGLRTIQPEQHLIPRDDDGNGVITPADANPANDIDWWREYTYYYINNQHYDGYTVQRWCNNASTGCGYVGTALITGWGEVLVQTATLFDPNPVAVGSASPMQVVQGCVGGDNGRVAFSHSASYHLSSTRIIADYQWLFDVPAGQQPNFDAVNWAAIPDGGFSADGRAWHSSSRDASPVYRYLTAGTFTAALRVVDDHPAEPKFDVFTVPGIEVAAQGQLPPTATAAGPYAIIDGEVLHLAGTVDDPNLRCDPNQVLTVGWDLDGDGQYDDFATATGDVPWATLAAMNLARNVALTIGLRVTDPTGQSATSTAQLTIYDRYPVACFEAVPQVAGCGDVVNLDARCSSLADPRRTLRLYEWQWHNENVYQPGASAAAFPFQAQAVGSTQSHVYPAIGQYRATLRLSDSSTPANMAIAQQLVTVEARRGPVANAGGPYVLETTVGADGVRVGTTLAPDGSRSSDPDAPCGDRLVAYRWDLDGDGQYDDAVGSNPTVEWVALQALLTARGITPAQYLANPVTGLPRLTIALQVEDTTGRTHTSQATLTIYHNGPYARFTVFPQRSSCNQAVTLDASSSYHGHPAHGIVRYEWDWDVPEVAGGDAAAIRAAFHVDGAGRIVTHAYPQFGQYYPVLRVTDDQGRIDHYWGDQVRVDLGNSPPQVDLGGPYVHSMGTLLALDASGTFDPDEGCGDGVVSYEWDFNGDGVFGDLGIDDPEPRITWDQLRPLLQTPAQYPAAPGTGQPQILLGLRVTDTFNESAVATTTLTIYDRTPVAVAHWAPQPVVPISGQKRATVYFDGSASYHGHPDYQIVSWAWRLQGAAQSVQGETASMELDLNAFAIPPEGLRRTFVLQVTDNTARSDDEVFDVIFNYTPSQPPVIAFNVPRTGVFLQSGEGFSVSAAGTTDPDGDWIDIVRWDLNGDGQTDIERRRTDTNGDGRIDAADADPSLVLSLTWAEMAAWGLQGLGAHTVRLTVVDSTNTSASDTVLVNVVAQAMIATATASPNQGSCTTRFTFDGSTSRHLFPGEEISLYRWDFDGNGTYDLNGPVVAHAYGAFGLFTARLQVQDLLGHSATATVQVSTRDGNRPPVPVAGGPYFADSVIRDGVVLDAGDSLELDAACGDRIVRYRWDLDNVVAPDGSRTWEIDTANPVAPLAWADIAGLPQNDADHRIVLEATDSLGATAQASTTLLIADGTPVASFEALPPEAGCGQPVSIDAAASYHPVPGRVIAHYEWDFDYHAAEGFQASAEHQDEVSFAYIFASMGDHTVALRVSDAAGRSSIATRPVSVSGDNQAPVARTNGPVRGTWGAALVLDASLSQDPNQACGDAIVRYEWDLDHNGGYEISVAQAVTNLPWGQVVAYGYQQADPFTNEPSYPITLRVTDRLGAQGTFEGRLRIYQALPVARASVAPETAGCGVPMQFDGRLSYNTHPDHSIVAWAWDFDIAVDSDGDGVADNDVDDVGNLVSHQYNRMNFTRNGAQLNILPHTARLTVTDDQAQVASGDVNATLSFENFRPLAEAGGPYITTVLNDTGPAPVNLDGTGSHDPNEPCDGIARYMWDTDNDGLYGAQDNNGSLCGALSDCEGPTVRVVSDQWQIGRSFQVGLVVYDAYGEISAPSLTTINVRDNVPPSVVLDAPRGGEVLRSQATLSLRLSHPLRKLVDLEFYLNQTRIQLAAGQSSQVWTEAGGAQVVVTRTFDTTVFADGRDAYRVRVVAKLNEDPTIFTEVFSRGPVSVDNTPPVVSLPAEQRNPTVEQVDAAGTPFVLNGSATDNLDAEPRLAVAPVLATYPLGATAVTFTATDWAGNVTTLVNTVTVRDSQAPTLVTDPALSREAINPAGTAVQLSPAAWDICDASVEITSDVPEGGFPVGVTTVHFTATDDAGNVAQGSTEVTITDTTPPRVTLPNPPRRNVSQTHPLGVLASTLVLPVPGLSDNGTLAANLNCRMLVTLRTPANVAQDVDVACGEPLPANLYFPNGETRIRFVVTDASNNTVEATYTIAVLDDQAPEVGVVDQPASDRWHREPVTVRFTVSDASDANPSVSVRPLPAGVEAATPNGDGVYELTYSDDGSYDVRIIVRDSDGNESVVILDRFGIDRSAPTVEIRQFPTEGVVLDDPDTYPVFFAGEEISPRFTAVDGFAGLKRVLVQALPGGRNGQAITLIDVQPVLAGTPPSGPLSLGNLGCTNQALICAAGTLRLREFAPGAQRFVFTATDAVDNAATLEAPFRILDLAQVLLIVREHLAEYALRDGVAAPTLASMASVDALLAVGQTSLSHGYLGGCLVSLEDATKTMSAILDPVVAEDVEADARLLARGALSDTYLYWERVALGTVEEASGRNFLEQARTRIDQEVYNSSILSSQNAYFYSRNAEFPFRATDAALSLVVIDQILEEMGTYNSFPDLVSIPEIMDAENLLEQNVRWKFRDLQTQGSLRPRDFMFLLLDLQDIALSLGASEDNGTWIRNWQWGLGQAIRVVVDLAKAEAVYLLTVDHCRIQLAQLAYDDGIPALEERDPDYMLDIYADPSIRCLMLRIYQDAGWQPAFPPGDFGCEVPPDDGCGP